MDQETGMKTKLCEVPDAEMKQFESGIKVRRVNKTFLLGGILYTFKHVTIITSNIIYGLGWIQGFAIELVGLTIP